MAEPTGDGDSADDGAGLGRRFFVGSLYLGAGAWLTSSLAFVVNILLARLLGPEALGFYALVFSIDAFIEMVGAFSIGLAVIQSPRESDKLYDTALAISFTLAAIGFCGTLVVAPILGSQRGAMAGWFLLTLGATRFLMLSHNVLLARMERRLRYKAVATVQFVAVNVPNLVTVGLAWMGVGVWSLLARDVMIAVLGFTLALLLSGYRWSGAADRATASRIMAFARPMFLSRVLEIAIGNVDRFLVGSFLGDVKLGLYHQARWLSETGAIATRPLSRLTFNLYSRLQDDPARLARSYDIVNYFLVRIVFSGVATLLVFPLETVRLLLGDEWVGAAPVLRWLALYAGLVPVFENMKVLLYGRGEVAANVRVRLVQLALFVPGSLAAVWNGWMEGVAAALLAATVVGVVLAHRFNRDVLSPNLSRLFMPPALCLVGSFVVAVFAAEQLAALPWQLLPFVPPVVYAALLIAFEHRRLWSQMTYLRTVVRGR